MAMPMLASTCSASLALTSARSAAPKPRMLHDKHHISRRRILVQNKDSLKVTHENTEEKIC